MADEEMVMDRMIGQEWGTDHLSPEQAAQFRRNIGIARARLALEQERASELFRMQQIAYQQALRSARPIIAQWSEWERQTRTEAWR
jgi:uncharacterized protein HemX